MINKTVRLKPSYAKWYLDHPDVYEAPSGKMDVEYEQHTLLHLTCCLGEPVYGKVIGIGIDGCVLVKWKVGKFTAEYYVKNLQFEVIK